MKGKKTMSMYWQRTVDAVHCENCNQVHGEDEVVECEHCGKWSCPSCSPLPRSDGTPYGYHRACAAYVDGESDVDPVTQGEAT